MLQVDKSPTVVPSIQGGMLEPASTAELYAAVEAFLRRQYPIIAIVVLAAIGMGAVFMFTTPARYTGTALMIIDSHKSQLFQQQSPMGVDMPVDSAMVDSQVEILKAENIALSVIRDLRLYEDPEFVGPDSGLVATVVGLVGTLFGSNEPLSEFERTRAALEAFQNALSIKRINLTYVIEIDFQSRSAERAAQIANAVADAYVIDALEAKYQSSRRAAVWLQDRLKELREQASAADRALVDYKAQNNIVDTGGRLLNEQQLAELNSALILARASTAEAKAKMDRVNEILRASSRGAAIEDTATVADVLHNEVITRLRQQYLDLSSREADFSRRYGADHLAVINIRNQMREIRRSIDDELHRIAETYKSDYEIAKTREDSIQKGVNDIIADSNSTNKAQITMRELEANTQSYRALADNFLQAYMQSVQQQSFPISESRLITQASPPLRKSYPRTSIVLVIALAGGLMLGVGAALARDMSDRVFRTGTQVEQELQLDCIAVVPYVKGVAKSGVALIEAAAPGGARELSRGTKADLLKHVVDSPFSRFAESIRSIKVAGDLFGVSKSNKVIGITSTFPDEGKSTISSSLAHLVAHGGARVLLIDGDLRNPALTREFAPQATVGLIEVISGQAALEDAVLIDGQTGLNFLPTVMKTRLAHTSEILASVAMQKLFDKIREKYDYVVVDLSPVAPVVDVRATAQFIDGYVYVVEWGRTKKDIIEHTLNDAPSVLENLVGVALNKADLAVLNRYEGYQRNYYHKRYYDRYGYTE
jgi:succinoglycan biosynthesis transport protein ExoP